jgi:indolepyruvate ferredoxin oxidoreductase beta subunit
MSHVRVSQTRSYGPLIPEGQGHIIVSIEPTETIRVLGSYGNPDIEIITNTRPIYPISAITGESDYPGMEEIKRVIKELSAKSWFLDATQISLEMGNPILTNMIMMGALVGAKMTELTMADLEGVLQDTFAEEIAKTNVDAAKRGIEALRNQ